MILLAIDLYGIRPWPQPTRITLKPGLNLVVGANGAGKTAAFHLLSSLLLNTPLDGVSFSENQPAQAAVIFQTKDGALYRITAD
ncbi:MAG TPA: AAA family ATPase, partial [Candidatus Manganitrophaceae bacterium]|nr:AAA family ATPase [Candidatus Manganitrophaceae bacterium]